ncbi:MAG: VCBS repeat-containing protein [Deltaproteobacteria bacterium]|nr:VCBS repeat-containing protein [Deltaproteobacteria bacterium]
MRAETALVALAALAACADLPALPHGACGNGVVEPGEDCDGAAPPGLACAPAGDAAQCRFTCATAACPDGWVCGADATCRHATGQFAVGAPFALRHADLAIADVDGDGVGDVIGSDPRGTRVVFGAGGTAAASPDVVSGPIAVADLDGDGRIDIATPIGVAVVVARGEPDHTVTQVGYAPFPGAPGAWALPLRVPGEETDAAVAVLAQSAGTAVTLTLIPSGARQLTLPLSATAAPSSLGRRALRADFDAPSAEDELVLAAAGQREVWIVKPVRSLFGELAAVTTAVALPDGTTADGDVAGADLDGDGDVDLLVGVTRPDGTAAVVAIENRGGLPGTVAVDARFGALAVPAAAPGVPSAARPFPLAIGDLDGDGRLDAVSPDAVFLGDATGAFRVAARRTTNEPWVEAALLDRGGRRDVVVASAAGALDVLRHAALGFTRVAIDTAGPADLLRVGDFDGDGLLDVAYRERVAARDRLCVLFGAVGPFAPPLAVTSAATIEHLEVGRFRDPRGVAEAADDLVLVTLQEARSGVAFIDGAGDRRLRSGLFLTAGRRLDLPLAVAAGRFLHHDTPPDLAAIAVMRDGRRALWVLAGAAGAAYATSDALVTERLGALATLDVHRMSSADLDGDGVDELVAAGADATGGRVVIARLGATPSIESFDPGVGIVLDLVAGDLDRDGRAELVIAGTTGAVRWRDGATAPLPIAASSVTVGQFDDDPGLEIAALAGRDLAIIDGDTLGVVATLRLAGDPVRVRAGDLDGDGLDDLAIGDGNLVTRLISIPQVPR